MVNQSRIYVLFYGDLVPDGAKLEDAKGLHNLGVTLHSKLTFEIHLRKFVLKTARSLDIRRRARKLFERPRVLKSSFNAYVLSNLEYCAHMWMSSAESPLGLLNTVVHCAESLHECELYCLQRRRKVSVLCLLYNIYHRADHPLHEYLHNFVASRNTITSAALCELALVIPCSRTDSFSLFFLLAAVRLRKQLSSGVFSGGTLSSFKNAMNLCLQSD